VHKGLIVDKAMTTPAWRELSDAIRKLQKKVDGMCMRAAGMDDSVFERKHPRNQLGRFEGGEGGGASGNKEVKPRGIARDKPSVAHLSGDELGIRKGETVKDAAKRYYEGLMKDPAKRDGFGEVKFYKGSGWSKFEHTSKSDEEQLRLLPAIKPIIEKGEYLGSSKPDSSEGKKKDIVAYHYFEANVSLNGKNKYVGVTVIEDKQGRKFYNLVKDPDVVFQRKSGSGTPQSAEWEMSRFGKSGSGTPGFREPGNEPLGNATDSVDGILNMIVMPDENIFKAMREQLLNLRKRATATDVRKPARKAPSRKGLSE
jgi:hypothetical protein